MSTGAVTTSSCLLIKIEEMVAKIIFYMRERFGGISFLANAWSWRQDRFLGLPTDFDFPVSLSASANSEMNASNYF